MQSETTPAVVPWGKWDKASLQLIVGGGAIYFVVLLLVSVSGIVIDAVSGQRLLTLPVLQPLPASADGGSATLVDGNFDSARVVVSDLSSGATALLTAGSVVIALSNLLAVGAFLYLAWRLLRREPFLRSLTWTFVAAGGVLLLGSVIGQGLTAFGSMMVATELGSSLDGQGFWPLAATFDAAPIGLAFVLMLVASAFEYAQKLTAETRGLV